MSAEPASPPARTFANDVSTASAVRVLVQLALDELTALPAGAARAAVVDALRPRGASAPGTLPPSLRRAVENPHARGILVDLFAQILESVLALESEFGLSIRAARGQRSLRFEILLQPRLREPGR